MRLKTKKSRARLTRIEKENGMVQRVTVTEKEKEKRAKGGHESAKMGS